MQWRVFSNSACAPGECCGSGEPGSMDCVESRFPPFFRATLASPCRQWGLLLSILLWAVVTGFCVHLAAIPILIVMIGFLTILSVYMTAVVAWRKTEDPRHLLLTTFLLYLNALVSILAPFLLYQCWAVVLSLILPYFMMCFKQAERMHILIAFFIVCPTILTSTLAINLPSAYRCTFYLPAMIFYLYKAIALGCSSGKYDKIMGNKVRLTTLLHISAAAIVIGAAITAIAPALDLKHSCLSIIGPTLLWVAGVFFNCILLLMRWEDPAKIPDAMTSTWTDKSCKWSIAVCVLMGFCLPAIYLSLSLCRLVVVPVVILFFSLYIIFVHRHNPPRRQAPKVAYIILILAFFSAMMLCTSVQVSKSQEYETLYSSNVTLLLDDYINATELLHEPDNEMIDSARQDTSSFLNLMCFLLFMYFFFSALLKTGEASTVRSQDQATPSPAKTEVPNPDNPAAKYVSFEMMINNTGSMANTKK